MVGIRVLPNGRYQAYVRVRGTIRSKCFPPETAISRMKAWREEQRVRARLGAALPTAGATFAEDVAAYLQQVRSMPTYRHRSDDLARWLTVFGRDRLRQSLTASEIRTQLETWRAEGYAPSTCNHRRTALMHLWSVLDGRSAPNPARDVPRYAEDAGPPQALSPPAIAALLAAMPRSQTKARLTLMAWTGWPQKQIMRLEPADVDWRRAVYVKPRRKGKGVPGTWLPLLPQAWTALREFKRLGCWGPFSTSSMRKSLRLAAEHVRKQPKVSTAVKAEVADVTPYQFRHSFGTLIAVTTQDDRAVQTLLQHADIRQTHRYTSGSVDPRVAKAIAGVASRLQRGRKSA